MSEHEFGVDIPERQQAQRRMDELFRALIENALDVITIIDAEGFIRYQSPSVERVLGYKPAELIGVNIVELLHPDDAPKVHAAIREIAPPNGTPGIAQVVEARLRHKDGSWRILESIGKELPGIPSVAGIVVNSRDITERKWAEEVLRESEEKYRTILESIEESYFEVDIAGNFTFFNESVCRLLGYSREEMMGMNNRHYTDKTNAQILYRAFNQVYRTGVPAQGHDWELIRKDGTKRYVECSVSLIKNESGQSIGFRGIIRDITERKWAEETLRQAQKTESLGILAGGIAHDFNNLLVAMLGQTSLALAKLPAESAARAPIEKAVSAAQRAADLTRQMLAYSGRGQFQVRPLRLNALVQENLRLLEVAVPKHVHLRAELADGLPLIEADTGQMQQVLMNLIINAAEAIGDRAGMVTVATGVRELTPADGHLWRFTGDPLPPGRYVALAVRDDGCGMDAETLARIFDPFFTTKFTGRGLGLAAVLGIIRGHKGGLHVESTPGVGTTFHLVFPASAQAEAALGVGAGGPPAPPASGQAESLILVIDDEAPVREAVGDILEMVGVRVLAAADGAAGVALYRERATDVSPVLLDLSMPGLSGVETFRQLRQVNPQVRVVISSGYDESEVLSRFAGQGLTGFIQKPYSAEGLIAAIRRHLA